MHDGKPALSASAVNVLEMIAAGSTYEQILAAFPDLTYVDIFESAQEAVDLLATSNLPRPAYTVEEKRARHARAYEKWTDAEDESLRRMIRAGATVAQCAGRLQRNRGGIRARIVKLNLIDHLRPEERARLLRILARNGGVVGGDDDANAF